MPLEPDRFLSKSDFIRSIGCVKRLWLDRHRPDLKPELSLATRERMAGGRKIGELARLRYPNGQMTPFADDPVEATRNAIAAGAECLFEATFSSEGRSARIDVIWKGPEGTWIVDEVKMSTVKEPAILERDKMAKDLAFQVLTATQAGFEVESARLVLVDSSYVLPTLPNEVAQSPKPGGQLSLFDSEGQDHHRDNQADSMLKAIDMTHATIRLLPEIESMAKAAIEALASTDEPAVDTNTHCKGCDYFDHCHAARPKHDVIFLPGIRPKEVVNLRMLGYDSIDQIQDDYGLTERRQRVRDAIRTGMPQFGQSLREALSRIVFPAAFIDYETSNSVFPLHPGTKPYQQICFQWSAHVLESCDSTPDHSEFLAGTSADPRAQFCRSLWDAIRDCRSIIHYTGFEVNQIRAMADPEQDIPLASELLLLLGERGIDLQKIIEDHFYHPEFMGRTSIKVVLPALVPSMSYKGLLIADGQDAAAGYREMIATATSPTRKSELRTGLLQYCEQDTLAMVEIYRRLIEISAPPLSYTER